MSEQHTPSLGATPPDGAGRDCVHVAVMPAVAGQDMACGMDVFIGDDDLAYVFGRRPEQQWVGIVDPFLRRDIRKGERFWVFIYPGAVTGMRHVWRHPALDDEATPLPVSKGNDIKDGPDDSDEPYSCSC